MADEGLEELRPDGLYHLATTDEWATYQETTSITPGSLESEGFIHCSWGRQVPDTLVRHFAGRGPAVALELDPALIGSPVVEEPAPSVGQTFPHIYAPIPVAAVITAVDAGSTE